MSPGILGKKIGMTQVFRAGRAGGAGDGAEGRSVCRGAAQDAGDRWLRCRAARASWNTSRSPASSKPRAGHLEEIGRRGREVPARVSAGRRHERRPEGRRPRAGGRVQAQGKSRRDRHQQGPRIRGRGQAASFPRRPMRRTGRCSTARRDRSALRAFRRACFPGMRMGGQMGTDARDGAELEIVEVDAEDNVLLVKGAVPGPTAVT